MSYGLTPEGFSKKTVEIIVGEMEAAERASIDPALDTNAETPLGQINGIVGSAVAECWEVLEEVYKSIDRDAAEDDALDSLGALLGVPRPDDSNSKAYCTISLEPGAVLPAGSICALDTRPDVRFELAEEQTNTEETTQELTGVLFEALDAGPVVAAAGQLTRIITPVDGWNSVTNPLDATLGRLAANNQEYRQILEDSVAIQGSTSTRAIRADLLELNDTLPNNPITQVLVYENTSDYPNSRGMPAHSVEALVYDDGNTDNNAAIAEALNNAKAGGIGTFGNISVEIINESGETVVVRFSRPTDKAIYVALTVLINTAIITDQAALTAAVKAKIVEYGEALPLAPNSTIVALAVRAAVLSLSGVIDVPTFAIGFGSNPTEDANLTLGTRERPDYDTSRVAVTISTG